MATNNKMKTAFAPCFSVEVFGAETARALDALLALEECVSAEMRRGGVVAMESVPFARPTGVSIYEADALTWRFYHYHNNGVAHALNNAAHGGAFARAPLARPLKRPEEEAHLRPSSVDDVRAAIAALRALCISD
jgi:hypothetical protein